MNPPSGAVVLERLRIVVQSLVRPRDRRQDVRLSLLVAELRLQREGPNEVVLDRAGAVAHQDRVLPEEEPGARIVGVERDDLLQGRDGLGIVSLRRLRRGEIELLLGVVGILAQQPPVISFRPGRIAAQEREAGARAIGRTRCALAGGRGGALGGGNRLLVVAKALVGLGEPLERAREAGIGGDRALEGGSRRQLVAARELASTLLVRPGGLERGRLGGERSRRGRGGQSEPPAQFRAEGGDHAEDVRLAVSLRSESARRRRAGTEGKDRDVHAYARTGEPHGPGDQRVHAPELRELPSRGLVHRPGGDPQVLDPAGHAQRVEDAKVGAFREV